MAKLVIQTQYMENYDVDQTTEEGHWKYKGGHDYIINDIDVNDYHSVINELLPLIEYDNSMSREYVIDWEIKPDWFWANPYYSFVLDRGLNDVEAIVIDPSNLMADVDKTNNYYLSKM